MTKEQDFFLSENFEEGIGKLGIGFLLETLPTNQEKVQEVAEQGMLLQAYGQ